MCCMYTRLYTIFPPLQESDLEDQFVIYDKECYSEVRELITDAINYEAFRSSKLKELEVIL